MALIVVSRVSDNDKLRQHGEFLYSQLIYHLQELAQFHIIGQRYTTFGRHYKANRRFACRPNVGE